MSTYKDKYIKYKKKYFSLKYGGAVGGPPSSAPSDGKAQNIVEEKNIEEIKKRYKDTIEKLRLKKTRMTQYARDDRKIYGYYRKRGFCELCEDHLNKIIELEEKKCYTNIKIGTVCFCYTSKREYRDRISELLIRQNQNYQRALDECEKENINGKLELEKLLDEIKLQNSTNKNNNPLEIVEHFKTLNNLLRYYKNDRNNLNDILDNKLHIRLGHKLRLFRKLNEYINLN